MNKPACKNCRYWTDDQDNDNEQSINFPDIKRCSKPELFGETKEYLRNSAGNLVDTDDLLHYKMRIKPEFADLMMFTQDGSDYKAYLYTRSDFYCAHFDPAPTMIDHVGSIDPKIA